MPLPRLPLGTIEPAAVPSPAPMPQARGRVIRELREKTADVDAVCRRETVTPLQARIRECPFHESLTGVERAVDLERADVVAPARELVLLARRHLALRVQHSDANAAPPVKRRRDGTARVARRRDEDRQRPGVRRAAQCALHQRREEAGPDVLESGRGPVEQLEHRKLAVRGELLQRQREIERVAADGAELLLEAGAFEERREHLRRDLGQRLAAHGARVEPRQLVGHVESRRRRPARASPHRRDPNPPRRAC